MKTTRSLCSLSVSRCTTRVCMTLEECQQKKYLCEVSSALSIDDSCWTLFDGSNGPACYKLKFLIISSILLRVFLFPRRQCKFVREYSVHVCTFNSALLKWKGAEEVYEVFYRGQKHKPMAHIVLNTESSRSHAFFTVRVVQVCTNWWSYYVIDYNINLTLWYSFV